MHRQQRRDAIEAGALEAPEPVRRDSAVRSCRRHVDGRRGARERALELGAPKVKRDGAIVAIALAQEVPEDQRGGRLAREDLDLAGGQVDDSIGYFVRPTIVQSDDPTDQMFKDEYFGPILSVHVYDDRRFESVVDQMESFAPYALTGAVISQDRGAVKWASERLRFAAGNFYVNDKPTGAVVGQQPFGGSRASGTNDKAGSMWNLIRWVSPRTIKETFVPPQDYRYPFLDAENGDGSR